ncbi:MAG: hypothetical protein SF069_01775 [Phycisphaerae bacterium]|nr:hypothetical protein [Phycisphaerae bacterium]
MAISPGSTIEIKIDKLPRNAAAQKTLVRLCCKDRNVVRAHRQRQAKRPSWKEWIRGGMTWHHQMESRPAVTIEPGAKYTIRASVDVIRDLGSVMSYITVSGK